MKRFHVHLVVRDLAASIAFYERLFGCAPSRRERDYAKWMLEDPRLNFAISDHGERAGLSHLGLQVETPGELAQLRALAESAAPGAVRDEGRVSCCYAQSDKHWASDPQGIAWEHFLTTAQEAAAEPGAASAASPTAAASACGTGASACCATQASP